MLCLQSYFYFFSSNVAHNTTHVFLTKITFKVFVALELGAYDSYFLRFGSLPLFHSCRDFNGGFESRHSTLALEICDNANNFL